MAGQVPLTEEAVADAVAGERALEVAPGLAWRRLVMVNVVFLGEPGAGDRGWVLVDAGLPGSAGAIEAAAAERFGEGVRPAAIVLTHGHFDHVGALEALSARWDAPVLAHPAERPFLDGTSAYPDPAPAAGGGLMAWIAPLYPRGPADISDRLRPLPEDGTIPGAAGWRWLHTPGHTPGHVSLWREAGQALVSGDAVITTRQEAAYAVATQAPELHGPPAYFTPDWEAAEASAHALAALQPNLLVPGHGRPMQGAEMRGALDRLARDFSILAVPGD